MHTTAMVNKIFDIFFSVNDQLLSTNKLRLATDRLYSALFIYAFDFRVHEPKTDNFKINALYVKKERAKMNVDRFVC